MSQSDSVPFFPTVSLVLLVDVVIFHVIHGIRVDPIELTGREHYLFRRIDSFTSG